jgi:general secretion pathway protein C
MKKFLDRFRKKSSPDTKSTDSATDSANWGPNLDDPEDSPTGIIEGKVIEQNESTQELSVAAIQAATEATPVLSEEPETPLEPSAPTSPPLEEPAPLEERSAREATEGDLPPAQPDEPTPPAATYHPEEAPSEPYRVENTQSRLNRVFNARQLTSRLARVDYMAIADKVTQIVQRRGYAFYGKLLTVLLCAFFLADVLAILLGSRIPEPHAPRGALSAKRPRSLEDFSIVMSRNLFNRKGLLPGEDLPNGGGMDPGGAPVKSTLPFNLLGTVILKDERRSIAAIEDKSASIVYPVRVDEEIPGKARIVKVEPTRVIFVNTAANRREYIDLPEDVILHASTTTISSAPGIEQVAPNQFNIDRKEIDKALGDLNNILTQARAVPNFENGVAAGYKLFQIVPHSIYDQLGLKNGDVISGIDGQPVSDPGKAFELLNSLKTRSNLELQVTRNGKMQTNSYEIQ